MGPMMRAFWPVLIVPENTAESGEARVVGGGDHLGDVHHEGALRVALRHGNTTGIVERSFVEGLGTVLLCLGRGGQVEHKHLHQSFGGREPLAHDGLHERLALEVLCVTKAVRSGTSEV